MKKARATKNAQGFITESQLIESDLTSNFIHKITLDKKRPKLNTNPTQKHENIWFKKKISNPTSAVREVIAQEFFRLFLPNHPKTRFAVDDAGNNYVISKMVTSFVLLENMDAFELKQHLRDGTYYGLGDIMIMALLMNEVDLKFGNMGVDEHGKIVKIDGDLCFAKLNNLIKGNSEITPQVFNNLPWISSAYATINWLDLVHEGVTNPDPETIDDLMIHNEVFRNEINRTSLKIALTPSKAIRNFISHYTSDENEIKNILNDILIRKDQIQVASNRNTSYQIFSKSTAAKYIQSEHSERLKNFHTTSNHFINPRETHYFRKKLLSCCHLFAKKSDAEASSPLVESKKTHSSKLQR
jgi:hypothetical protein